MDYASLTPIDRRVLAVMKKYSAAGYANPSSWYREGVAAKTILNDSRKTVAEVIHAHADEIFFTAGGTEANNMAIIGAVEALRAKDVPYADMHVIVSAIEHSSVRECANYLSDREVAVDVIGVTPAGIVDLDELKKKIRPNTVIVSIMTVNNEIGTIQPIREIAKIIRHARKHNAETSPFTFVEGASYPLFHTDAAQAGYVELNVEQLGVDLLTLDGSKVYGPRGIGALYKRRTVEIAPVIHGGGQEKKLRSGTENLPAIAGLAQALSQNEKLRRTESLRLRDIREQFIRELRMVLPNAVINGDPYEVSPHIVSVTIPRVDAEFLVLQLDAAGIACSTKSSCLRDEEESYVLRAIGQDSRATVRFSFGRKSRTRDVRRTVKQIMIKLGQTN